MSPVENTPPHGKKQPARTDFRLRELERARVGAQGVAATVAGEEFPGYSVPGIVADGSILPSWYAQTRPHPMIGARVSAVSPPSSDCEFHLALNGTTMEVLILPAGSATAFYVVSFTVNINEFLGGIVVLGGGAIQWSMQLEEAAA